MFFNVLAFILSLGEPGNAGAGEVADSASRMAASPVVAAEADPAWVFASAALVPLVRQGMPAVSLPEFAVNLHPRRRSRVRHARLDLTRLKADLQQSLAAVRELGPARSEPAAVPVSARGFVRLGGGDGADTLWREEDGLFYVSARINGAVVRLIVDTGASYTVLSAEDARRVGVDPGQITFGDSADTAAGASPMARIVLANLEIGQNMAAGVPAMVASGPLRTSLLGQNVLSRLGSVTIEGDRMTLR
ncbi:TIGR02281 family clan AA aspartic protease [Novosphingobium sp. MMS21-SN21R]|uniref:retropepsin-like aspartic protease family protein n=1 Tax=Novosphingobium sp. MMS21-SN21R TaxID=2969298 RepID=UPI00288890E5|nr:TIGR02281 family clan AA aspartic protease [Novosphingobium sp. MMS21-SN21R]MDT0508413.1 TIGR02281 family clan AA aspartic protease [Novosphingobium sp. MMS21-SN21R]